MSGAVFNGGSETLATGAIVSGTILTGSGLAKLYVGSGGTASGTVVNSGGNEIVVGGGMADGVTIAQGGTLTLYGGASVSGAVFNGGDEALATGATVSGTVVSGSGLASLYVGSGATASGAIIEHGGAEIVLAGGSAIDTTISGGRLVSLAGALTSGAVTFAGTGRLEDDTVVSSGTHAFGATLTDIDVGDKLDLTGLAYGSGPAPTATVSGSVLTVSNVTASETFTLDSPGTTSFSVARDSGTGILVTGISTPAQTFVFNAGFGQTSVADFSAHLGMGAGHETISLPRSDFADFAALLTDTTQTGSAPALITAANGDQLALPNITLAALQASQSNFVFHA